MGLVVTAIRKDAGLYCGPRLRKGEVFAYVGLSQNLKDLNWVKPHPKFPLCDLNLTSPYSRFYLGELLESKSGVSVVRAHRSFTI